jgi:hypothetical protein
VRRDLIAYLLGDGPMPLDIARLVILSPDRSAATTDALAALSETR